METPTIIKFVKKGDTVQVRIGKDRGKTGKVVRVLSDRGKVIVEGLNLVKKHVRPKREGEKRGDGPSAPCHSGLERGTFLRDL